MSINTPYKWIKTAVVLIILVLSFLFGFLPVLLIIMRLYFEWLQRAIG